MSPLTLAAPAKLNLYLYLTGKRADGYHELESFIAFTELADTLTIRPAELLSLTVDGEFAEMAGAIDDNLVMKAARMLAAKASTPVGAKLTLTKNIPVGGGLGGGSSDAAAALRGLNRFWKLNLSQRDLQYLAASLGADVPMCLHPIPAIAEGVGEKLIPLLPPPPPCSVLLVYPRAPLLTKRVFAQARLGDPAPPWTPDMKSAERFIASLASTSNHLQRPAIAVDSRVAEVLLALETLLPKPDLVRMTGSGACCFGLYANAQEAARGKAAIAHQHPHWWVTLTQLKQL